MKSVREVSTAEQRRLVARSLGRSLAIVVVLVTLYYLLPLSHVSGAGSVILLILGLVGVTVLISLQVFGIVRSEHPGIRGVEALSLTVPLFLLLFSAAYYLIGRSSPSNFNQRLSRTDALYFTVTTFSTVGYGDITATSEGSRLLVTFQIMTDLVVLGFGVKVVFGAVERGRSRVDSGGPSPPPASDSPGVSRMK